MSLQVGWDGAARSMGLAEPIVYIDRSSIREGKQDVVREKISGLVEFIAEQEPQLTGYWFFFNDEATEMTVIAIHPDSDSLEKHMEIGMTAFREFSDLIDMKSIHVFGSPSDEVLDVLADKAKMLGESGRVEVHDLQAGFLRLPDEKKRAL